MARFDHRPMLTALLALSPDRYADTSVYTTHKAG
jgi:hypothetical protein